MLVIEGADCTGKTTLAHKLVKMLNDDGSPHIYQHLSRLPPSFDRFCDYEKVMSTYTVQDRSHMSEPIYAAMRGDETDLTPWLYDRVDAMLLLKGMFVVVVYVLEDELIRDRYAGKDEMYSLGQVLQVNKEFARAGNTGVWGEYRMHVDYRCVCTRNNPWPNAEEVFRAYTTHMELYHQLQRARRLHAW